MRIHAPLEGLEPPTCGLEVRCSIQLSYRGFFKNYNQTPIFDKT